MAHSSYVECCRLGDSDLTPWEGGVHHEAPHGEGGTILVMLHQHMPHNPVLLQGQEFRGRGAKSHWEEDEDEAKEE